MECYHGALLFADVFLHENLVDVFRTALDVAQNKERWGRRKCLLGTGRDAHSRRCPSAPCVEIASVEISQRFPHLLARLEKLVVKKGLAPVLNFRWAASDPGALFSTWQLATVWPGAEEGLVRSTCTADSGGACQHGLLTDLDKEANKLARKWPRCAAVLPKGTQGKSERSAVHRR